MNKIPFPFSMIALALLLSGCVTYNHPDPVEAKESLQQAKAQGAAAALTVPAEVQAELLPTNPVQSVAKPYVPERRFRVAAKDVEAALHRADKAMYAEKLRYYKENALDRRSTQ